MPGENAEDLFELEGDFPYSNWLRATGDQPSTGGPRLPVQAVKPSSLFGLHMHVASKRGRYLCWSELPSS